MKYYFLAVLVLLVALSSIGLGIATTYCTNGYEIKEDYFTTLENGKLYRFIDKEMTFATAKHSCKNLATNYNNIYNNYVYGHLVTFKTEPEWNTVFELYHKYGREY